MKTFGIDVSRHNGKVDWKRVKESGKTFVMIRSGWSWYEGGMNVDKRFIENIEGALAVGLDVGVYIYAYDKHPQAAKKSAQRLIELLAPYKDKLKYPIVYDVEENQNNCLIKQGKEGLTNTVISFLSEIQKAGYYAMLYSYTYFLPRLNMDRLKAFDLWIADYREPTGTNCPYDGDFGMWQYKGKHGKCDGVSGSCDLNISYKDYPKIISKLSPMPPVKPPKPDTDYKKLYEQEKAQTAYFKGKLAEVRKIVEE